MIQKLPSYKTPSLTFPFSTYEWVKIWHETIGKEWELYLLNVNNNVIAPFAKKNNEIIFAGGDEVADYLDIIGPDEKKIQAWREITSYVQGCSLHLRNIPENSPTISFFKAEKEDTTPITTLHPILNKKNQHEMERKIRKFEREHNDIKFADSDDTEILFLLMKLDARKKEFLTSDMEEFFRQIMKQFGKLTILTVNNTPAAAMLTLSDGETLMGYNSGFDETNFSGSGFYLRAMMLSRARGEGYKYFNFLQGSERYKYELGGKDFFVYKVDTKII